MAYDVQFLKYITHSSKLYCMVLVSPFCPYTNFKLYTIVNIEG